MNAADSGELSPPLQVIRAQPPSLPTRADDVLTEPERRPARCRRVTAGRSPRLVPGGRSFGSLVGSLLIGSVLLSACGSGTTRAPVTPPPQTGNGSTSVAASARPSPGAVPARLGDPQTLATGLEAPWGLAFLPG